MVIKLRIALYISGHGYGHLAQIAPVVNRIAKIAPSCCFLIRSALPEQELRRRLDVSFTLEAGAVDVGVYQKSAVEEDIDRSIVMMRAWVAMMPAQLKQEIGLMQSFEPDLILSDISPLAFPVARALKVPGVGLATLDWHTIYSHWLPADDPVIEGLSSAYAMCDLLLRPPMAMSMPVFSKQHAVGLITAKPRTVNFSLKAGRWKHCALVAFGGSKQPPFEMAALAAMSEWLFLIPDAPSDAAENIQSITLSDIRVVDLLSYVDLVVCKPGYGMLAECWQQQVPLVWLERPDFPEYPMLKRWLERDFPGCMIHRTDFSRGIWQQALDAAMAVSKTFPAISVDGSLEAADHIVAMAKGDTA